jgi:hypothetical protein
MSNREEDLKKYLNKKERKKKREDFKESSPKASTSTNERKEANSLLTYFYLRGGIKKGFVMLGLTVLFSIGSGVTLTNLGNEAEIQVLILGIIGLMILLFLAIIFLPYPTYQKFAAGTLYPVLGWNHFIASRSDKFWSGDSYVHVTITFDHQNNASQLERKAVQAFVQDWINRWGYRYKGKKFSGPDPEDFKLLGGYRVQGHVNLSGMAFVLDQLLNRLPALVNMLPAEQLKIDIGHGPEIYSSLESASNSEEMLEDQQWKQRQEAYDRE